MLRDLCKKMVSLELDDKTRVEEILQAFKQAYAQNQASFFKLLEEKDSNGISPRFLAAQFAPQEIKEYLVTLYQQSKQDFNYFIPDSLESEIFAKCKGISSEEEPEERAKKLRKIIISSIQKDRIKKGLRGLIPLYKALFPESISIFDDKAQTYIPTPIKEAEEKLKIKHYTNSVLLDPALLSLFTFKRISGISYEHLLGLRHLGPTIGWACFAQCEIPQGTPMGTYEGRIKFDEEILEGGEPGFYTLELSANRGIYVIAEKIGGLNSRMAHLLNKTELDENYDFSHLPFVKECVATENISIDGSQNDLPDDLMVERRLMGQSVKKGMIVGCSYGEAYFGTHGITPYIFDHYGNPIPRWFYARPEMSFQHPDTGQVKSLPHKELNLNLIAHDCRRGTLSKDTLSSLVDTLVLDQLKEKFKPSDFTNNPYIDQYRQQFLEKLFVEQGYLPPKPVYEHPNNLSFELRSAAKIGDFNKIWYMLEYDEKCDEILEHMNDIELSTGDTALHLAAANGHLWVAAFLLLTSKNKDPKLYLEKTNQQGKTPAQLAEESGHFYFVEVMDKVVAWLNKRALPQEAAVAAAVPVNADQYSAPGGKKRKWDAVLSSDSSTSSSPKRQKTEEKEIPAEAIDAMNTEDPPSAGPSMNF